MSSQALRHMFLRKETENNNEDYLNDYYVNNDLNEILIKEENTDIKKLKNNINNNVESDLELNNNLTSSKLNNKIDNKKSSKNLKYSKKINNNFNFNVNKPSRTLSNTKTNNKFKFYDNILKINSKKPSNSNLMKKLSNTKTIIGNKPVEILEDHEDDYYKLLLDIDNKDNFNNEENNKSNTSAANLGGFTEKVLEEITDEQDHFEAYFTTMFLLGCLLVPLILIFSEYIKPYDAKIIQYIQTTRLYQNGYFFSIRKFTKIIYNLKFHSALCLFIYLAIDPGVGFKVSCTAGLSTYIAFYLEILIHDSRPYWNYSSIKPLFCHMNFGCPAITLFTGFLYYHLFYFNINRAIMSKDPFMNKNKKSMQIVNWLIKIFIFLNFFLGFQLVCNGENYIYQVLVTFFIGFVIIRILITFNKEIDYFTNGARYVQQISNVTSIWAFIYIILLASFSWIIFSVVHEDLTISKNYILNINVILFIKLYYNIIK